MPKTYDRPIANNIFGVEHKGMVETAIKANRSESFHAKLENLAYRVACHVANSLSGIIWFSMDDLDDEGITYRDPMAAGLILDTLRYLIKQACKDRGDFWYEVEMVEGNWEIEISRGKVKRRRRR